MNERAQMRDLAALAIAALILGGVWSVGKWIVGRLTFTDVPIMSRGIDPIELVVNAKDLPKENWQFRAPVAREGTR
jgi:hypothetical protein